MSQSWDSAWETVFSSQAWGAYPSEHIIRWVARNYYKAPDRSAVRLLDLGSGPGANTWFMAREGFQVSAIDGSPTGIALLNQRLGKEGLQAETVLGDFIQLPWADGTFDGVVDNAALCCNTTANAARIVAEVHRVLKPGGTFCSTNFTDRSWGYGLGKQVEPGGFTAISDGPLHNKGFCLFMGRAAVDSLYSAFADTNVERISWTADDMTQLIELWVVTCRKPL
jgi:SAM-dependent methyltransferase